MASTSLQSPWRSNGAASTVTGNFRTVFILLRPRLKRRRRSATLCLDSSTSSGSSCSSSLSKGDDFGHLISEKSIKKGGLADGSIVIVEKIKPCDAIGEEKGKKENSGNKLVNWSKLMAKRKRPLWRRILFGSSRIKNIILLNVAAVVYASNIPVVKEVEAVMDPAAFSAVRFVMSAIPFLPFVFRAKDDAKTRNAGIELGMWVSLGYLVEALGLLTSEAGRASFISLFTVIVVPLLDGILGSIIPARTWLGVLMSVVGVGMLECSGSPPNVGDLLNFLSAIFFGIHMLRTEHISRCTKQENFLALLGYEISVVAVMSTLWLVIGGWVDGTQDIQQASWTWMEMWNWLITFPWFPALYTGIFSTGLCLWVEISAMRDVSATETAIIYGLEPVWGAAFAWFLLGERWGTVGWIGAALVLGGSLTVQIYGSSTPTTEVKNKETEKISVLSVLDKKKLKNGLSASPVVVRSREDMKDMLK